MRSHRLRPLLCIEQSATRRLSGHLRAYCFALARAVDQEPRCQSSRCQIWSAGVLRDSGSSAMNSLRFSRSRSKMSPKRLVRASDCVARRAAPGSCSARRAQPRRGLDRAEQSIREHGTHNFLWAEECNFMPQPSKMQKRSRGGLRAQIGRVPHTPQDGFTARDQMADGFVISGS